MDGKHNLSTGKRNQHEFFPLFVPTAEDNAQEAIGNCLNCGKIAWITIDDNDLCSFCSHPLTKTNASRVSTPISSNALDESGAFSNKNDEKTATALREALQRTAHLLEYQRTWTQRSHIFDDAVDWFRESNNMWCSPEQRHAAKHASEPKFPKNESRQYVRINLETHEVEEYTKDIPSGPLSTAPQLQETLEPGSGRLDYKYTTKTKACHTAEDDTLTYSSASLNSDLRQIYDLLRCHSTAQKTPPNDLSISPTSRVIKQSTQLNSKPPRPDVAVMCIGLPQSTASLVIEGRESSVNVPWYTDFRGRLWLCWWDPNPKRTDVSMVSVSASVSCVIGSIDLIGCVPQAEPEEEPYPTWCEENHPPRCSEEQQNKVHRLIFSNPQPLTPPIHLCAFLSSSTSIQSLMSLLFQPFVTQSRYVDRQSGLTLEQWEKKVQQSTTVYVGNLSYYTTEDQIYELFSLCGDIDILVMGLNRHKKSPCGFCFISHEAANRAISLLNGSYLDFRPVRVDWDIGENIEEESRCYGRGVTGRQWRDEFRKTYDLDRGGEGGGLDYATFTSQCSKKRHRFSNDRQWGRYGHSGTKRRVAVKENYEAKTMSPQ